MARLPRLVLPGFPYHVTQRGNRRQPTFFHDDDYALYRDLLAEAARKAETEIWCYCLMPNHVHLIVVPSDADGLRRTFADAHRRYTGYINARNRWTGHLWQGRFGAVVMDDERVAMSPDMGAGRGATRTRSSFGACDAVRVAQFGAGEAGRAGRTLALVKRSSASVGGGLRIGACRARARPLWRFRRVSRIVGRDVPGILILRHRSAPRSTHGSLRMRFKSSP